MPSRARRHQEAEVPVARPGAVTLANSRRNGYTRPASVTRLDSLYAHWDPITPKT